MTRYRKVLYSRVPNKATAELIARQIRRQGYKAELRKQRFGEVSVYVGGRIRGRAARKAREKMLRNSIFHVPAMQDAFK